MMRRLFVGVRLDQRTHSVIDRYVRSWQGSLFSWTEPENRHMTLFFLGRVEDEALPEISESMRQICMRHEPFDVTMQKIGVGPNEEKPKMIWLKGELNEQLSLLQEELRLALGMYGKEERKQFRPHVTLGRIRSVNDASSWKEVSADVRIPIEVSEIVLYESTKERGKVLYVPLDVIFLGESE